MKYLRWFIGEKTPAWVSFVPSRQTEINPSSGLETLTWYIDMEAIPPTAVPDYGEPPARLQAMYQFFSYGSYWGLPDTFIDHLGNLRGKNGKIIFAYEGGPERLDK